LTDPSEKPVVLQQGSYLGPAFTGLENPAVLVVDMSNDFGHPEGVYGRHGVTCEAFPAAVLAMSVVLRAAAAAGLPTIAATQIVLSAPDGSAVGGGGLVESRPWLAQEGLRSGTWGVRLVDELPATDYVVEKPRASAFIASHLEILLRGLDIKTLVVGGCYTNQCIDSTVRDAWARDLHVVVVSDGVAAFDRRLHDATLESLLPLTAQLPAEEVARQIAAGMRSSG
jgi:ureidoacrylate peracid hydrolase